MDHRARLRAERQAKSAARFHFSSVDLALRGAHSSHFGRPASPLTPTLRILQGDHPPSVVCRPTGGGARPALQHLSGPTLCSRGLRGPHATQPGRPDTRPGGGLRARTCEDGAGRSGALGAAGALPSRCRFTSGPPAPECSLGLPQVLRLFPAGLCRPPGRGGVPATDARFRARCRL